MNKHTIPSAATIIAAAILAAATPAAAVTVTDVSPDTGCCPVGRDGATQGGQIDAIIVDPVNSANLFAASQSSGVWKSVDGARHWFHSSTGLSVGETARSATAIAQDPRRTARLLYATSDEDFGPFTLGNSFSGHGGLHVSLDAARSWRDQPVAGCQGLKVRSVAFSMGVGFAGTSCGVARSTDSALTSWTTVAMPGASADKDVRAIAANGKTLVACDDDNTVYSSTNLGVSWTRRVRLLGSCQSVFMEPDAPTHYLAAYQAGTGDYRIARGSISGSTAPFLAKMPPILNKDDEGANPSGVVSFNAVRRPQQRAGQGPGRSYSLFVANGAYFYEYRTPLPHFRQLSAMHIDTHGMAIPSNFDPDRGRCKVYVANDGGVYVNGGFDRRCSVLHSRFREASHGLHLFGSTGLAFIAQKSCPAGVRAPCPALYLAGNDNGTWASLGGQTWTDMGCCGDNGVVLADWQQPNRVVVPRNDSYWDLDTSSGGRPPLRRSADPVQLGIPGVNTGSASIWYAVAVQTPPGATPPPNGDYFAIKSARFNDKGLVTTESIIRNTSGTRSGWRQVGPDLPAPGASLQVSDAGNAVFVLTTTGKVVRLVFIPMGPETIRAEWQDRSTGLSNPVNLLANPFDPNVLYAVDIGDPNSLSDDHIMQTTDGGVSWRPDAALTDLAKDHGRLRITCASAPGGTRNVAYLNSFNYVCSLTAMAFDPTHPEFRFAVMNPAGVAFSRDGGAHWRALNVTKRVDRPSMGVFDPTPNPATRSGSLYVALHNHGLIRVDANWPTL